MSIVSSVTKIGEVVATWLDPERREKAKLRSAIESADKLIKIHLAMMNRPGAGEFSGWQMKKLMDYELHYMKRFNAWRNG